MSDKQDNPTNLEQNNTSKESANIITLSTKYEEGSDNTLRNSMQEQETVSAKRAALEKVLESVPKEDIAKEYDYLFVNNTYTEYPLIGRIVANRKNYIFSDFIASYGQSLDGRLTAMSDFNIEGIIHTVGAKYTSIIYALENGSYTQEDKDFFKARIDDQLENGLYRLEDFISRSCKNFFQNLNMSVEARRMIRVFHTAALEQKEYYTRLLQSNLGEDILKRQKDNQVNFIKSDVDLTAALIMFEAQARLTLRYQNALKNLSYTEEQTDKVIEAVDKNPINPTKPSEYVKQNNSITSPSNKVNKPTEEKKEESQEEKKEEPEIFIRQSQIEAAATANPNSKGNNSDSTLAALQMLANTTAKVARESKEALKNANDQLQPGINTYKLSDISQIGRLQTALSCFLNADLLISEEELGYQLALTYIKGLEIIRKYKASSFLANIYEKGMQRLMTAKIILLSDTQRKLAIETQLPYAHTTFNAETVRFAFQNTVDIYKRTGSSQDAVLDGFDQIKQIFMEQRKIQYMVERYRNANFFLNFYEANKEQNHMYGLGMSTFRRYSALMERDF